ncbi:Transcription factor Adf-1 [Lucilia cuprina]|nr:Transcription factor Adf-1 [Lucilia cuprina]
MFTNNKNKMKKQIKKKRFNPPKILALNEEELIQQVAMRPVIYDRSLKAYRKTSLRKQCWAQISEAIDAPVEECRRRWRSLRDSFAKHYKLYQRSDQQQQGNKHRKWVFYDKMQFLIPFLDSVSYDLDKILDELGDLSDDGQSINCEPVDLNATNAPLEQIEQSTSNSKVVEEHAENPNHNTNNNIQHSSVSVQATDFMSISMETPEEHTVQLNHTNVENNVSQSHNYSRQQNHCNNHNISTFSAETNTDTYGLTLNSDEKFLLSCAPTLRRLTTRKNALARLKIQQILFDIEFQQENN